MNVLIILNEGPLTGEKAYNALRIGTQFLKDGHQLKLYLIGDGVYNVMGNTKAAPGAFHIEAMMEEIVKLGGDVKMCTTCGNTRGLADLKIVQGATWTNLKTLTDWVIECDKVINC